MGSSVTQKTCSRSWRKTSWQEPSQADILRVKPRSSTFLVPTRSLISDGTSDKSSASDRWSQTDIIMVN